jgi:hypothetical protein
LHRWQCGPTAVGLLRAAEPIIIHYESVDPIHSHPDGSAYFRCRLSSSSFNDFGR